MGRTGALTGAASFFHVGPRLAQTYDAAPVLAPTPTTILWLPSEKIKNLISIFHIFTI
jgi:hypothetical protein